jgi:hypothetical protein
MNCAYIHVTIIAIPLHIVLAIWRTHELLCERDVVCKLLNDEVLRDKKDIVLR